MHFLQKTQEKGGFYKCLVHIKKLSQPFVGVFIRADKILDVSPVQILHFLTS